MIYLPRGIRNVGDIFVVVTMTVSTGTQWVETKHTKYSVIWLLLMDIEVCFQRLQAFYTCLLERFHSWDVNTRVYLAQSVAFKLLITVNFS